MSCNRDLTLDEALADPMIGAALRADRVDPRQFETLLRATALRLGGRRQVPSAGLRPAPLPRCAGEEAARGRRPAAGDVCAW